MWSFKRGTSRRPTLLTSAEHVGPYLVLTCSYPVPLTGFEPALSSVFKTGASAN